MGADSKIEWTHHSFNPWRGCTKVSPACKFCYAEKDMSVLMHRVKWGPRAPRRVAADSTWRQPLAWNRKAAREGRSRRVFCASLADVFEARDDLDEHRARLWELIEATPNLDWLLLTKRPEEVMERVPVRWGDMRPPAWPENVWIGTTVENQEEADKRIPELLRIPARVRFLSMEPLLSPVNLDGCLRDISAASSSPNPVDRGIQWVIAGGESGPNARPPHPDWFRSLRDQCEAASVPFHFKQWGRWVPVAGGVGGGVSPRRRWLTRTGDVLNDATRPDRTSVLVDPVGKKVAGRALDGRTWDGVPR